MQGLNKNHKNFIQIIHSPGCDLNRENHESEEIRYRLLLPQGIILCFVQDRMTIFMK